MTYDYSSKNLLDIIAIKAVEADLAHLLKLETPAVIAVVVPDTIVKGAFASPVLSWLRTLYADEHEDEQISLRRAMRDFVSGTIADTAKEIKRESNTSREAHWLIFVSDPDLIDARMRMALDAVLEVKLSTAVVAVAADIFDNQLLSEHDAAYIAGMPGSEIDLFFRRGRDISDLVQKLEAMKAITPREVDISAPRLEDLDGYGEAKVWGLELATDIRDWSAGKIAWRDVDRGILLSGAPGCGKTTFASALARTCGVEFLSASYAQWQAHGHQGDMLKAMRRTFMAAIDSAPCILLIDEVDSFPDRDADHGNSSSYVRGVVNGFLELLDGTEAREGVVVVGACNNPSFLDKAIVRAGRLDRHVQIQLPDEEGRLGVLKFHLSGHEVSGLNEIAQQTEGMSGADLERIVREGRRLARRDRRPIRLSDLQATLPVPIQLSDERLHSAAIHEVGHALVGAFLKRGQIRFIKIVSEVVPTSKYLGAVSFHQDITERQTRSYYEDQIAVYLAGMAAEQMLLGGHDEGVVGDLRAATHAAATALGTIGMGASLVSSGAVMSEADIEAIRRLNPRLDREIDEMLHVQAIRAREILEQHRDMVVELSEQLFRDKTLDPSAVYAALSATKEPVMGAVA